MERNNILLVKVKQLCQRWNEQPLRRSEGATFKGALIIQKRVVEIGIIIWARCFVLNFLMQKPVKRKSLKKKMNLLHVMELNGGETISKPIRDIYPFVEKRGPPYDILFPARSISDVEV